MKDNWGDTYDGTVLSPDSKSTSSIVYYLTHTDAHGAMHQ